MFNSSLALLRVTCVTALHLDCILQMLISAQDSGQGWFSPTIPALSHGLLFIKVSRGKLVLAKQRIPAEVMVGQTWLKGYQNQATSQKTLNI